MTWGRPARWRHGTIRGLAALTLAGLCAACGDGADSPGTPTPTVSPTQAGVSPTPAPGQAVTVTLTVDPAAPRTGQPATFTMHITAAGNAPVTLEFPTGQRFEVVVSSAAGAEVWRWSGGKFFTQAFGEATVQPGQPLEFAAEWDGLGSSGQALAPGRYTATATLPTTNSPQPSAMVEFDIQP